MAKAFRNTGSLFCSPIFKTVIDAPVFSLMNIAFVRQNSSYGLIIKVIPSVLKVLFSLL
jgi:hypothetical protein